MKIKRINYECDVVGCTAQSPISHSGNSAMTLAKREGWKFGMKQHCPEHAGGKKADLKPMRGGAS